jgi:site-specific recombinase XerD
MQIDSIKWEQYPLVGECLPARTFLVRKVQYGCRPKTIDAYGRNLNDYLATFRNADVTRLVDADTGEFLTYLARLKETAPRHRTRPKEGNDQAAPIVYLTGHRRSDASIAQAVTTIRQFYDFLIQEGLRTDVVNPVRAGRRGTAEADDTRGSHGRRGVFRPMRYLPWTPDDAAWAAIVTHVLTQESMRNKAMFVLCYDAALRREELISLELTDVDFSQALVRVRPERAKNGRERRIPFSGFTDLLLRQYLTARTLLLGALEQDQEGPLFVSESTACPGRGLSVTSFNLIVRSIREATGYPRLTPHVLRHQRCTIWRRSGLSLDDIALLAGHVSTESTKIYVHMAPHDLASTARAKTRWFDGHMERLIQEAGHER